MLKAAARLRPACGFGHPGSFRALEAAARAPGDKRRAPASADARAGAGRHGRSSRTRPAEGAAPRNPLPAGAKPPGRAPAAPGACSRRPRARAPSQGGARGRQTLAVRAPQISATLSAWRGGPTLGPGKRLGSAGAAPRHRRAGPERRRSGSLRECGAALPGSRGRRPSSRARTCGGRAGDGPASPGSCARLAASRTFCPEPWASPASGLQFWPRLGARVAGLISAKLGFFCGFRGAFSGRAQPSALGASAAFRFGFH